MGENTFWILLVLMPLFAFLYASVGHGGASSYLMLLSLLHFAPEQIRPTALILNIFVSGIAFLSFRRVCKFPIQLFLFLIIFSVPAAYWGGSIVINTNSYKFILGLLLLFPALRLFNFFPLSEKEVIRKRWWIIGALGLSIGFVSGLIGIGGGIILSPILLLLGWASVKETSAVSALFIFLNSVSGLVASTKLQFDFQPMFYVLMPVTILGGIAGAYLGANRFNIKALKYLLATVLLIASFKFLLA